MDVTRIEGVIHLVDGDEWPFSVSLPGDSTAEQWGLAVAGLCRAAGALSGDTPGADAP